MSELTPRQRSQISALKRMPDDQIDTSDIPEVLNWSNVTRGAFYRPGQKHVGRAIGSTTDTSEKGLERLICEALTGAACDPAEGGTVRERPAGYAAGWICGDPRDYDRAYCVDLAQLAAFLHDTQPNAAESLDLGQDSPTRRRFLARLQGEVTKRGTIDVLRGGVKHGPHQIDLMYGTPSPGNEKARVQYRQNRFSVTQAAPLQQRQRAACPGPVPVHQRPAGRHLRAEEQPDEADGARCHQAVQARPQSNGETLRARPLPGPLRRR